MRVMCRMIWVHSVRRAAADGVRRAASDVQQVGRWDSGRWAAGGRAAAVSELTRTTLGLALTHLAR